VSVGADSGKAPIARDTCRHLEWWLSAGLVAVALRIEDFAEVGSPGVGDEGRVGILQGTGQKPVPCRDGLL
jgi:hypothetical protein